MTHPRFEGAVAVVCPHCGEAMQIMVDTSGGILQDYVEDCQVCCRPWRVRAYVDERGMPHATLEAD